MNEKLKKLYKNDVTFNRVVDEIADSREITPREVLNNHITEICLKSNELKNKIIEDLETQLIKH